MKKRKEKENEEIMFKVLIVGDPSSGKKELINRNIFFDSNTILTLGISFSFKDIILKNNKKIRLKLVDSLGQERYRSLSKSYFGSGDAILFTFSLNEPKSFEYLQYYFCEKEIFIDEKKLKYLVGTNNDLEQKINQELINELVDKTDYKYFSINARSYVDIDSLYEEIAESLYNNYIFPNSKKIKDIIKKKYFRNKSFNINIKYLSY